MQARLAVGVLPAVVVAGGIVLGTQVAVVGVVDVITGFMEPAPEIPPISPIGLTTLIVTGDVKTAKQIETLFSIGKLFTKSAEGLEYALDAIKTGIELYQGGRNASTAPLLALHAGGGGGKSPARPLGGRK